MWKYCLGFYFEWTVKINGKNYCLGNDSYLYSWVSYLCFTAFYRKRVHHGYFVSLYFFSNYNCSEVHLLWQLTGGTRVPSSFVPFPGFPCASWPRILIYQSRSLSSTFLVCLFPISFNCISSSMCYVISSECLHSLLVSLNVSSPFVNGLSLSLVFWIVIHSRS